MIETTRALPHSLDAERAVLGAVLISDKAWPVVASVLRPEHFYRDAHQRVFHAMARLAENRSAIDWLTLRTELERVGDLVAVGGPSYVLALTDGVPHSTHVEHYARIVREKAMLRTVILNANRALAAAYEDEQPAQEVVQQCLGELLAIKPVDDVGMISVSDAAVRYVMALESETVQRWPTGLVDLDALTGGLRAGRTMIVAGRPGSGKTSLGLSMGLYLARNGQSAAVFTREMDHKELAGRVLGWGARASTETLERHEATDRQLTDLSNTLVGLQDVPLRFEEMGETVSQITAWCERLRQDGGLAVAIVDYMQLLKPERSYENRTQDVASISRGLSRLAKSLGIAVVALSALSRAPDARKDKRPALSDLRESGAIEQDADVVVLLHRPEQYKATPENQGIAEAIVAKQRSGPTGVVRLAFIKEFAMFGNLDQHHGD